MKKLVYKFFDEFCFSELIVDDEDNNWFKPSITYQAFGYSSEKETIFYNEELQDTITRTFGVSRFEFKNLLREWFEDRYKMKASLAL
jgi:hypothetical protein